MDGEGTITGHGNTRYLTMLEKKTLGVWLARALPRVLHRHASGQPTTLDRAHSFTCDLWRYTKHTGKFSGIVTAVADSAVERGHRHHESAGQFGSRHG